MTRRKLPKESIREEMQRDIDEYDALVREYPERFMQYLRLGFTRKQIREALTNDELWEKLKNKPAEPNNAVDWFIRRHRTQ